MAPGKTIVISTHILEEVHAVCTRAIIIATGASSPTTPAALEARSRYHAVTLTLAGGDAAAAREALAGLPGVAGVEDAGHGALTVPGRRGASSTAVGRLLLERGWRVESLARARPTRRRVPPITLAESTP
jgi:ABC-2 type transport system ATP-binding protein